MLTPNAALMVSARESLRGKMGTAIGVSIVFIAIRIILSAIPVVGWIAGILLTGPLLVGLNKVFLAISRGEQPDLIQLFDGFRLFGNALAAYVVMIVYIVLWGLLLIVPGIIAAVSYSQTFFLLADNEKMDGLEALRKSKEMMQGNKWKFCCLNGRFIGWFLLCIVTLGIAFLWVLPYLYTSNAKFHEDLMKTGGQKAASNDQHPS